MKVETISRQTIRPATPTPDHLKRFSLSIFDQFAPSVYTPIILFYTEHLEFSSDAMSDRLKTSLSDTLSRFYPFAGRIKDNICIECNDEGVEYLEARVRGTSLRNVLAHPEPEALKRLLPIEMVSAEAYAGSLLWIQVSVFECGGIAIAVCVSHKIGDAATMSCFIKCWAESARNCDTSADQVQVALPDFSLPELFPPSTMFTAAHLFDAPELKCTSTRYSFDDTNIAALRTKSSSENIPRPTRIEAVCALIWKCATRASQPKHNSPTPSLLAQTVNLRPRIIPPLPPNSVGNFLGFYTVRLDECTTNDLPILVKNIRTELREYTENYAKNLVGPNSFELICEATKQGGELVKEDGFRLFIFTSWCKLGLYGVDFGWGKPIWTGICGSEFKNTTVLMDARDGEGVEAWVTLPKDDMVLFQQDEELLSFACLNPNVWFDVVDK